MAHSKEPACNVGDLGSISGLGRSPGEENWLPTSLFWSREFHTYIHTGQKTYITNIPKTHPVLPPFPETDYQAQVSHNLHAILPLWQLQTQKPLNIRNLGHCLIDMPPPHFEFRGEMTCSRSRTELQNLNLFLPVQGVTKSWTPLGTFHVHTL